MALRLLRTSRHFALNSFWTGPSTSKLQCGSVLAQRWYTTAQDTEAQSDISVAIADPTSILNAVANSYEGTNRVLMEFVDNAIDSADEMRHDYEVTKTGSSDSSKSMIFRYPFPVNINVDIDIAKRNIWIRDNCSGIPHDRIVDLVMKVGQSHKSGCSWVNGQFGFGMQSFRAAAKRMTVYTKQVDAPLYRFAIDREQRTRIAPPSLYMGESQVEDGIASQDGDVISAVGRDIFSASKDRLMLGGEWDDPKTQGTSILIAGFDPVWFRAVTARGLSEEIQSHFESLLWRENLTIEVRQSGGSSAATKPMSTFPCEPFDYEAIIGSHFRKTIPIKRRTTAEVLSDSDFVSNEHSGSHLGNLPTVMDIEGDAIHCNLVVSRVTIPKKRVRFFRRGRCINYVSELRSFIKSSKYGAQLWEHPFVCGVIEVGDVLDPVITRDEFRQTWKRAEVYNVMHQLEEQLMEWLDRTLVAHQSESEQELEGLVHVALKHMVRKQQRSRRDSSGHTKPNESATIDAKAKVELENDDESTNKQEKPKEDDTTDTPTSSTDSLPLVVKLVPLDDAPESPRSYVADGVVYINTQHPEYLDRVEKDSRGRSKIGARMVSYLSGELSSHYLIESYKKHQLSEPAGKEALIRDHQELTNQLESSFTLKRMASKKRSKTLQTPF